MIKYIIFSLMTILIIVSLSYAITETFNTNVHYSNNNLFILNNNSCKFVKENNPVANKTTNMSIHVTSNTSQIITSNMTSIMKCGVYVYNNSIVYIYLNISFTKISILGSNYIMGGPIMVYNGISEIQNSTLAYILDSYKCVNLTIFSNGRYYNLTLPVIQIHCKLDATKFFYPECNIIPN